MLSYLASRAGGLAVVRSPAEIDLNTAPQLENELNVALLRGVTTLVVDMSETTFCDSAGTGVLVRVHLLASDMHTTVRLVAGKSIVRRVFEINGITEILPIYDSVAAAEKAGAVHKAS